MKPLMLIRRVSGNHSPSFISLLGFFKSQICSYSSTSTYNNLNQLEKSIQTRCRSGSLEVDQLLSLFNSMIQMQPIPSATAFNHLRAALSKKNQYSTVFSLYKHLSMRFRHFQPDVHTLTIVIKCLCRLKKPGLGFSVFASVYKYGLHPDGHTLSTLLHELCMEGSMVEALELFHRILDKEFPFIFVVSEFHFLGLDRCQSVLRILFY